MLVGKQQRVLQMKVFGISSKCIKDTSMYLSNMYLVGGFNPSEKC